MKITTTRELQNMPATQSLGHELNELKTAKKASSFHLQTTGTPPSITADEFRRLIEAANQSKKYRDNRDSYYFTMTESKGRQTLSLKQQGLFSKFKFFIGIDSRGRAQRRGAAANLIKNTFSDAGETIRTKINTSRPELSKDSAVELQKDLMSKGPWAPKSARSKGNMAKDMEDVMHIRKLMAGKIKEETSVEKPVRESEPGELRNSFTSYDPEKDSHQPVKQAPVGSLRLSSDQKDWLQPQPLIEDEYNATQTVSSWQNADLINPPVGGGLRLENPHELSAHSSTDSEINSHVSTDNLYELLLKRH
jgi:hypothetical protein